MLSFTCKKTCLFVINKCHLIMILTVTDVSVIAVIAILQKEYYITVLRYEKRFLFFLCGA